MLKVVDNIDIKSINLGDFINGKDFKIITYSTFDKDGDEVFDADSLIRDALAEAKTIYSLEIGAGWGVYNNKTSKFEILFPNKEVAISELYFYWNRHVLIKLGEYVVSAHTIGEAEVAYQCYGDVNIDIAKRCGLSVIEFTTGEHDGHKFMYHVEGEDYMLCNIVAYNVLANDVIDDDGIKLINDPDEMCNIGLMLDSESFQTFTKAVDTFIQKKKKK